MVRTDPRVEYDRHEVTILVGSAWHEPVSVRYLGRFNPAYEVPGRNKDGSDPNQRQQAADTGPLTIRPPVPEDPPTKSRTKRVLAVTGDILVAAFAVILWVVLQVFRPAGQFPTHSRKPAKWKPVLVGKVSGGPNCLALGFADTARANPGRLWLAWSPSWLALVSSTGQSHVVWQCRGNDRPVFDQGQGRLVWPDGSVVRF